MRIPLEIRIAYLAFGGLLSLKPVFGPAVGIWGLFAALVGYCSVCHLAAAPRGRARYGAVRRLDDLILGVLLLPSMFFLKASSYLILSRVIGLAYLAMGVAGLSLSAWLLAPIVDRQAPSRLALPSIGRILLAGGAVVLYWLTLPRLRSTLLPLALAFAGLALLAWVVTRIRDRLIRPTTHSHPGR